MKFTRHLFLLLFFIVSIRLSAQVTLNSVKDHSLVDKNYTALTSYTSFDFGLFLSRSGVFRHLPVLAGFNSANATGTPTSNWDYGQWGQGSYSNYVINEYNTEHTDYATFWSNSLTATPKVDVNSKLIRAHIHAFLFNGASTHLDYAKLGVDFLLSQQLSGGDSDGGWIEWTVRDTQTGGTSSQSSTNAPHIFATSYAVRALVEFYLASGNTYISGSAAYKKQIFDAIARAASFLQGKADYTGNFNYIGLCEWGIASAFKVTGNCENFSTAMGMAQFLMNTQDTISSGAPLGQWNGRQLEGADGTQHLWHDNKIAYHMIILRGLVETLDITENAPASFKARLLNTIKRGFNQVIDYRLRVRVEQTDAVPNLLYLSNYSDGTPAIPNWLFDDNGTGDSDYFEAMYYFLYYSKFHSILNTTEQTNLLNLINYTAKNLEYMPPKNPHNDRSRLYYFSAIAQYSSLLNAYNNFSSGTRVFPWQAINYDANRISKRTVSGDFDGDGDLGDIAAFYDNGNSRTNLHVWTSNGAKFSYAGALGWWIIPNQNDVAYDVTRIADRVVAGDFNNDSRDDIAAFYNIGNGRCNLHVWLSAGSSFTYGGSIGWWKINTNDIDVAFDATTITGRVVAGDFDNDGHKDDIAAFSDNGGGRTTLHVWISNGSQFTHNTGWWSPPPAGHTDFGYDANRITDRVVVGNFDGISGDDIATFYDLGNGHTNLHVWFSSGTFFSYGGSSGKWTTGGGTDATYDATKITGRVVTGKFDADGRSDIAAFYDDGSTYAPIHMWTYDGTSFTQHTGWWTGGLNANVLSNRVVAGDFASDNEYDDIAAFFDCGSYYTKLLVWKTNGANAFTYEGIQGWWAGIWTPYARLAAPDPEIVTGIETPEAFNLLFPNPASQTLFVRPPDNQQVQSVEFLTTTGQRVLIKEGIDNNGIDVSNLSRGIYIVKINTSSGQKVQKLLLH